MSTQPDPFIEHEGAITMAAAVIYRAEKEGVEPDPETSRVVLAQDLGDLSPEALRSARIAEAEVNVGARVVARVASLQDGMEAGGVRGLVDGFEFRVTRLFERKYLRSALREGGPVDRVRSKSAVQ